MRRPRTSPINRVPRALAVLAVVASWLALTAQPAAAAPSYTLEERAAAIASPSAVFLEFRLTGFVRDKQTGATLEAHTVALFSRCSGFVVSSDGFVVTSTHCLDPVSLLPAAASVVANDLIFAGKLTAAQKASFVDQTQQTAVFTGALATDPPITTAKAQLYTASTGPTDARTITVTVVDSQSLTEGETTLVKLDRTGLPVAQLADEQLPTSTGVVQIAFGTNDATTPRVSYTVRTKGAMIAGDYGNGTRYQLDSDLGSNAHGGMVTDADGKVVGMITADVAAKDKSNKIVTPAATITKLLDTNHVKNTLSPIDQTYRYGLNAYFGGHYTDAMKKLDAVIAAMPDNTIAQTYRKQAADRLAIEGDPTGPNVTVTVVLAVVAGLAVLGLMGVAAWMVLRGRRRQHEFTYFDPYTSPSSYPTSSGPVSAPTPGWPPAAPTSGMPTSGLPQPAPTSGMPPTGPVPVVPTSAVPASPFEPPTSDGFYYPPALEPPTTYPVVVPVPPPTPMSVAPQYGQALPEPWAPPVGPVPVPVPGPVPVPVPVPPTGTLYPSSPQAPPSTPPEPPVTGQPAAPPVGAEPPTRQPWDVPHEERMYGAPPEGYRHRP